MTTRNCSQTGCSEIVVASLVWPAKGRLAYCTEHFAKACLILDTLGLPVESLDIELIDDDAGG
jgi:hypothetical protein